jgi:hypothetical protein
MAHTALQAKEIGKSMQKDVASTRASSKMDERQCMYEVDWLVSQPVAQSGTSSLKRLTASRPSSKLLWANHPSVRHRRAVLSCNFSASAAASATGSAVRQTQVLQHILAQPGASHSG